MKRFYIFAMLNGITIREAIQPAKDAVQAIHAAGWLPDSIAPLYDPNQDMAHFVTPQGGVVLVAQRA